MQIAELVTLQAADEVNTDTYDDRSNKPLRSETLEILLEILSPLCSRLLQEPATEWRQNLQ